VNLKRKKKRKKVRTSAESEIIFTPPTDYVIDYVIGDISCLGRRTGNVTCFFIFLFQEKILEKKFFLQKNHETQKPGAKDGEKGRWGTTGEKNLSEKEISKKGK